MLLAPGKSARFEASGSNLELLHMVTPKPPAAVEEGLPGGPGYFFNRTTLRPLTDASGGRVRRFCAESTVRLLDGSRLTPTNAIQAGEMRYHEGGSSPYHRHVGTSANPDGPSHCYITFKGRGVVQVGDDTQELEPGTLVFFPTGVPHRLRAHGGPLDYFEIQAWQSFKTNVLSEGSWGSSGTTSAKAKTRRSWSGTRAEVIANRDKPSSSTCKVMPPSSTVVIVFMSVSQSVDDVREVFPVISKFRELLLARRRELVILARRSGFRLLPFVGERLLAAHLAQQRIERALLRREIRVAQPAQDVRHVNLCRGDHLENHVLQQSLANWCVFLAIHFRYSYLVITRY